LGKNAPGERVSKPTEGPSLAAQRKPQNYRKGTNLPPHKILEGGGHLRRFKRKRGRGGGKRGRNNPIFHLGVTIQLKL